MSVFKNGEKKNCCHLVHHAKVYRLSVSSESSASRSTSQPSLIPNEPLCQRKCQPVHCTLRLPRGPQWYRAKVPSNCNLLCVSIILAWDTLCLRPNMESSNFSPTWKLQLVTWRWLRPSLYGVSGQNCSSCIVFLRLYHQTAPCIVLAGFLVSFFFFFKARINHFLPSTKVTLTLFLLPLDHRHQLIKQFMKRWGKINLKHFAPLRLANILD